MLRTALAAMLVLACPAICFGAEGAFEFRDGFAGYAAGSDGSPQWAPQGIDWAVTNGRYEGSALDRDFAFPAKAPHAKQVTIEATLVLRKAIAKEWKTAGLAVVADGRNYWNLALVEAPHAQERRHYVELCEMLDGAWLSQSEPATRLTQTEAKNPQFDWQYGRPYRLRLAMTPEGIRGSVAEADGREVAAFAYAFDNKAVTFGRPALSVHNFQAAFDDVAVRCEGTVPPPAERKWGFPPYTQAGRVPLPDEPRGKATGFFHVERIRGRWWVVDPKGRAFFVVGTDHANFRAHWCEQLGYAPYHRHMVERFGLEENWAADTAERLLSWGFNTVAAGHSPSLRGRGLAWTGFLSLGAAFSNVSDICPRVHWTGFPNVFHPKFPAWCDRRAREGCARFKDDPWLLGYFIDNELEWYGKEHQLWSLPDEAFKKPADHSAKQALLAFLRERYPTIERLNAAWGTEAASYDAVAQSTEPLRHTTERGRADKLDFLRLIAERYFAITTAAIRRHDPNHMVLGCRFAGQIPPGVGEVAGRHCDIFTINCYRWVDLETGVVRGFEDDLARWHAEVKRPFMITEWSFPALDSGLPCKHGAGQRFDTQAQKAKAFTIFQSLLFATPFMVGSDYFMWVDEPALGISSTFPEDSNYGLVNVHNQPYTELTEAAARLNPQVYAIHAGRVPDLSVTIEEKPWRAVVRNRGRVDAKTEVEVAVNGKATRKPITVRAGRTVKLSVGDLVGGQASLIAAVADPDQKLAEVRRADNLATAVAVGRAVERMPKGRCAVVLANPTGEAIPRFPVVLEASALPAARPGKKGFYYAFCDADRSVAEVQVDRLPGGDEATFSCSGLPAWSAALWGLEWRAEALEAGAEPEEAIRFDVKGDTWQIENGPLRLIKDQRGGAAFDRVVLTGKELGLFVPVIWQDVGQSLWPKPDTARIAGLSKGPVRLVLDIEFELEPASDQKVITTVDDEGRYADAARRPGAFRACYRFYVYPGTPWFGTRFLWLENADVRPWEFMAYFHYALSSLAGEASDDEVGGPDVPNYYRRDSAVTWFDPKAKLHYGITSGRPEDFQMLFWRDPSGGQHADVRREVKVTLKPGERYAEPQPVAYVFGASGERADRPCAPIAREIRRRAAVQVKVFPTAR